MNEIIPGMNIETSEETTSNLIGRIGNCENCSKTKKVAKDVLNKLNDEFGPLNFLYPILRKNGIERKQALKICGDYESGGYKNIAHWIKEEYLDGNYTEEGKFIWDDDI